MALPPLELFSLKKRPPCCRVASSCFRRGMREGLRGSVSQIEAASAKRKTESLDLREDHRSVEFTASAGSSPTKVALPSVSLAPPLTHDLIGVGSRRSVLIDTADCETRESWR